MPWKKLLLVALLVAMLFGPAGCYGKFTMTKAVYDFNGEPDSEVVQSVLFWVFAIILPVYFFSTLLDAALFNVIEFWSGENPLQ